MSKILRILHCLRAPVGGLFRHVCDLAHEQARLGHEVGILCDSRTGGARAQELLDNLQNHCALGIVRVPMGRQPGPRDLKAYLAMRRFAETSKAHILHGHGAKGGVYARLAAKGLRRKEKGRRAFYTPHGGSLHYDPAKLSGKIFLNLERTLEAYSDGIIFESDYAKATYFEKINKPGCECWVIPNGLLKSEFYEAQLDDNPTDFLFIGELRELKGIDLMLEALQKLNQQKPVTATIVGAGPDEQIFRALAHKLGLDEAVNFTGAMPAQEAFRRGRCLVVPSRAESLPYIVLEAAAAQIPLIMTNVGGIPEITAGSDMQLVPKGDMMSLFDQMKQFLNSPAPFAANAKQLKTIVSERYAIEKMTDTILDFYYSKLD